MKAKREKFDPEEMRRWRLAQPPSTSEEDFMRHYEAGQKLRNERLAAKQKPQSSEDTQSNKPAEEA
jgi:hypothetical protein